MLIPPVALDHVRQPWGAGNVGISSTHLVCISAYARSTIFAASRLAAWVGLGRGYTRQNSSNFSEELQNFNITSPSLNGIFFRRQNGSPEGQMSELERPGGAERRGATRRLAERRGRRVGDAQSESRISKNDVYLATPRHRSATLPRSPQEELAAGISEGRGGEERKK